VSRRIGVLALSMVGCFVVRFVQLNTVIQHQTCRSRDDTGATITGPIVAKVLEAGLAMQQGSL